MQTIANFRGQHNFLSNFDTQHAFPINIHGHIFNAKSGEHAFQALKTIDVNSAAVVLSQTSPHKSKQHGRKVDIDPLWNVGGRVHAMQRVIVAKFKVPEYREMLLATDDAMLIEGNMWHDNYWGDCRCLDPRQMCNRKRGTNMLGELLMAYRFKIKETDR